MSITPVATEPEAATATPQPPEETATPEPTGTIEPPTEEPTPTGTLAPTATVTLGASAADVLSDLEGLALLVILEPEKPTASPGDEALVNWRLEGWDQKETQGELTILFTVPEGFSPAGKEADDFDAEARILKIKVTELSGSILWLISEDAIPPFQLTADLFLDGGHEASSGIILVAPPEEGGVELDSEAPVITLVGWAGEGKGIFGHAWSGTSGYQTWTGPGGNWQLTRFHSVFTLENVPNDAPMEVCARGVIPFVNWSGGGPVQRPRAAPSGGYTEFTLGSWQCVESILDLRYWSGTKVGHHFGKEGRQQPGCCGGIPGAYFTWEVWIKSINGYEFPPPDGSLDDLAALADCDSKNGISDPRECPVSSCCGTQGTAGDPINTRTGAFGYSLGDIGFPTAGGPQVFQRSYSSLATDMYDDVLGFGWSHNQDTRLFFGGDPLGETGYVLFKAHTANQYRFVVNGDGTYTPYAGVMAELSRSAGPPVTYTVEVPNQSTYTFDEDGRLITWADPLGREFTYTLDQYDRLSQVEDPSGDRYLTFTYDGQDRISRVTDHTGRYVDYAYDGSGDLVTVTDVLGNDWAHEYDAGHRLTEIIDPLDHTVVRIEYDGQGRAVRQFDGLDNQIVEVTYNGDGTASLEDARGNVTVHVYNERNTLVSATDELDGETTKSYDDQFRLASITNPGGATTEFVWSDDGENLLSTTDDLDNTTSMQYDSLNNLISVTDPRDHTTSFDYDGELLTSSTDALDNLTEYTYTVDGYLETITDPLDHVTSFQYNDYGEPVLMTDPLDHDWTYAYDDLSRLVEATDPLGNTTLNEYDAAGRLTRVTLNSDDQQAQNYLNQTNIVTEYDYDAAGNLTSVTDTLDRVTTYDYDAANRLVEITDPADGTTSFEYDSAGNLVTVTDPLDNDTTYTYDELNRQLTASDPLLNTTTNAYDAVGNLTSVIDALGAVTRFEYDPLNRLSAVVNNYLPASQPDHETNVRTEYEYDEVGNLISVEDARGNVTSYDYDELNRLEAENAPLLDPVTYEYDAAGNLISITDAASYETSFSYDAGDRLTAIDYPSPDSDVSFEYDAVGNRTSMTDGEGETVWDYDELYRVTSVTDPASAVVGYEYDPVGNLTTLIYPISVEVTFEYDTLNRLTDVTDWDDGLTTYNYDAASRLTGATFPNDVVSSFDYDIANRLLELTHSLGQQALSSFAYDYDDVGNRIQAVDTLGSAVTIDYEYDPLYRLTAADYSTGEYFHYTYDAVGNRLTQQTHLDSIDYEYDAADRLIEVDGVSYTWDAKGNLLSDGVRAFTYNHANRVTQIEVGEDTYTFDYNGLGDRVRQTINETPTAYVLDLNAGLTQVLQAGSTAYLYGLGRIGEEQASGWQYHLGDALASVRQVTDPNGAVTLARSYEPFGSVLSTSGGASTAYGFTGEWTDVTALVFLRARYFDPNTGRFLSRDPFPGMTSVPLSRHPYIYAIDNPLLHTDPSGQVIPGYVALAGLGFLPGAGINTWMQYQANAGWCNYDPLEALAWGVGGAAASVMVSFTFLEAMSLTGLGLQGIGVSANLPTLFGWGTTLTGASGAGLMWMAGIPRGVLPTPRVSDPKLRNIVSDLYRGTTNPGRVGTGTTADAVRNELLTGQPTAGRFHIQKAVEYSRALQNWLAANPDAGYSDRLVAQSLLDDLQSALGSAP